MGKKKGGHLVPVKKIITRNGRTFETTVLVNPDKQKTAINNKTNIPTDEWSKITTLDDFERCRKAIFDSKDHSDKELLKREFVEFMERSGVKWNRCNTNAGVDYMRCMMKAKKMISNGEFVGELSDKLRPEAPYKKMDTNSARKLVQSFTKDLTQNSSSKDNANYMIKTIITQEGIEWKHSDNPNIDRMRMLMALREHIEDGKPFEALNDKREKNPRYRTYITKRMEQRKKDKEKEIKSKQDKVLKDLGTSANSGGTYNSSATSYKMPNYSINKSTELWTVRSYDNDIPIPKEIKMPKKLDPFEIYTWDEAKRKEATDKYNKEYDEVKKIIETLAEENYNRPLIFTDPKEIQDWAKQLGIEVDKELLDTNLVDIHMWNDVAPVVEEMLELYPQLKKGTNFDGVKKPFTIRYAEWEDDETYYMGGYRGLFICPVMRDYKKATENMLINKAKGWFVHGSGTLKDLVRHEFGHILEQTVMYENAFGNGSGLERSRKGVRRTRNKKTGKLDEGGYKFTGGYDMSKYNKYHSELKRKRTNIKNRKTDDHSNYSVHVPSGVELIAEGFASFTGGETTKFAKDIYDFMNKYGAISPKGKDKTKEK